MTNRIIKPEKIMKPEGEVKIGNWVKGIAGEWDTNGLIVNNINDTQYKGYILKNELSLVPGATLKEGISLNGQKIIAEIIGYYFKEEKFILSRKKVQEEFWKNTEVGDIIKGTISNITPAAFFVDIGAGFTALLPISEASECFAQNCSNYNYSISDTMKVMVTDKYEDIQGNKRMLISRKRAYPSFSELIKDYDSGKYLWVNVLAECPNELTGYSYIVEDIANPNGKGILDSNDEINLGSRLLCQVKRKSNKGLHLRKAYK